MNEAQRIAFLNAQCVAAQAEIAGMVAENTQREHQGKSVAYDEPAFLAVIEKYGLGHNAAIMFLRGE